MSLVIVSRYLAQFKVHKISEVDVESAEDLYFSGVAACQGHLKWYRYLLYLNTTLEGSWQIDTLFQK